MRFRAPSLALAVLLPAILMLAGCASAPRAPGFRRATLHGVVFETDGRPLDAVVVSADGARGVASDIDGRFAIPSVRSGPITVTAWKPGYERHTAELAFVSRTQVLHLRLISADELVEQAVRALRAGSPHEAADHAARALDAAPGSVPARYTAAAAALARDDPQTALDLARPLGAESGTDPPNGSARAIARLLEAIEEARE